MKQYVCLGHGCTVRPECRVTMDGTPCCCLLDGGPTAWIEAPQMAQEGETAPVKRAFACEYAGRCIHECGATMARKGVFVQFCEPMNTNVRFLPVSTQEG